MKKNKLLSRKNPNNHIPFIPLYKVVIMAFIMMLSGLANAADGSKVIKGVISGKITDAKTGEPLVGVSIVVKDTTIGTVTDTEGNYTLNVPDNKSILVVSYIGYDTQEVAAGNDGTISVTLTPSERALDEVVVTAYGIEKDAAKLGYATQKVNGGDLTKAREPNAINSLVGKVAGLTIGTSSELLGAPQIVLRGETGILIVVDGVPVVSDSWNVNADDVESYTVLKGPNAAALYGSRGQNGAILITTKRGTKNSRGFQVDVNSSLMFESGFLTLPKVQNEYGGGEYNTYRFGDDVFGQKNGYNQNDYDVWGPKLNGQLISQYDSPIDPVTGIRTATPYVARGKDNLQRFLQTGLLSTNNVAIAAKGDKYDLRASTSYSYQRGIVPNTDLNIANFNLSAGYDITKRLRFEANINYNKQFTENIPDVTYGPNSIIYNVNIWSGADWDINDLKNYWQPGKEGIQQLNYEYYRYNNPWFSSKEWLRGHQKTDVYGYASMKYQIAPWLSLGLRSQITTWDLTRTEKFPVSARSYGRDQLLGDYREDRRNLFENNTDLSLNINKDLFGSFNVSGLVGGNIRTYSFNESYGTTDYLNVPGVYNFGNSKNAVKLYNYNADMIINSFFYSFDFSYKRYVTLSNTGRYDYFSTFNKGYNDGFYPSIGISTLITEYVKLPEVISYLKLRGSYANVRSAFTTSQIGPAWQAAGYGNPIEYGTPYTSAYDGPIYYSEVYNISRPYNNQNAGYFTKTSGNPTLAASSNSSFETGFDIKFLKNRLGFDLTYFDAITGPQIVTNPLTPATGFNGFRDNAISTQKRGWEFTLSGTPVKVKDFSWNILTNWTTYKQTYKELYPGQTGPQAANNVNGQSGYLINEGDRVDNLWGTKFFRDPNGNILHDASGKIYTDNRKKQLLGHSNPDWVWSVINTISYKNWSLNFQFDGRIGGVGIDYLYRKMMQGGRELETAQGDYGIARQKEFDANPDNDPNKITPTYVGKGVALTADSPAPNVDDQGNITNWADLKTVANTTPFALQDYIGTEVGFDERVLISKTYAKLRQVTITYNIPAPLLKKIGFSAASISLVGRNLLYFAERTDIDWDQFIGTFTSAQSLQSPTLRRFGVNLNFTF